MDDEEREGLDTSARFLYGLIHARFIVTSRGLAKMVRYLLSPSRTHTDDHLSSSKNTAVPISAAARASTATNKPSSPSVSATHPTSKPSNSTVPDVKTSTPPNPTATAPSTAPTLAQRSHT